MKIIKTCFLLITFFSSSLFSQNHIPNPSFETTEPCPVDIWDVNKLTGWEYSTGGLYFHRCHIIDPRETDNKPGTFHSNAKIPNNYMGFQETHSGNGYVYLYINPDYEGNFSSILQCKLLYPLVKNQLYYTEFYITHCGKWSPSTGTNAIGIVFARQKISSYTYKCSYESFVFNPFDKIISDTIMWTKVSGTFIAKGGEQYLAIGNFYPKDKIKFKKIKGLHLFHWNNFHKTWNNYFIDDVKLIPIDSASNEIILYPSDSIIIDKDTKETNIIISSDIFFNIKDTSLLEKSLSKLDSIISVIKYDSLNRVEVICHTDLQINKLKFEKDNLFLTELRAKKIKQYLLTKGLKTEFITSYGAGSFYPIADNVTEEGRAQNRRIEFIIRNK